MKKQTSGIGQGEALKSLGQLKDSLEISGRYNGDYRKVFESYKEAILITEGSEKPVVKTGLILAAATV